MAADVSFFLFNRRNHKSTETIVLFIDSLIQQPTQVDEGKHG